MCGAKSTHNLSAIKDKWGKREKEHSQKMFNKTQTKPKNLNKVTKITKKKHTTLFNVNFI